jgi:diphthine-ammonia ligase
MKSIKSYPFFCSWSGGKDSCLALYYAIQNGGMPKALLTMLREDGERSRSHGLPVNLIQRQAQNLNIPIFAKKTSWNDYEKSFLSTLREFKKDGIEYGVFGDIDLVPHLEWVERVCSSAMIQPYEPLWKKARLDLLHDIFNLGFTAIIVAVKHCVLDTCFLGQILNEQVVKEMEKIGIDASGEKGEYHTVVTDGPFFLPLFISN